MACTRLLLRDILQIENRFKHYYVSKPCSFCVNALSVIALSTTVLVIFV